MMKSVFGRFMTTFLKGLVAILPIALSIYVVVWVLTKAEMLASSMLSFFWPRFFEFPGSGLLVGILLIWCIGKLLDEPHIKRLLEKLEAPLTLLPLVKTVYSAVKDLMAFLAPKEKGQRSNRVVVVQIPGQPVQMVGLLTRESLADLPKEIEKADKVAVYFPMSYQLGGYTAFLPREWVKPMEMDVERAVKSALTAWVQAGNKGSMEGQ